MKVFISWSGPVSHKVALGLHEWLPSVIQAVRPFVSSEDIDRGARWIIDVGSELRFADFGILCITPTNVQAPWILFEAGALSKSMAEAPVVPLLIGVKNSDLGGPLAQFNSSSSEKQDLFKLVKTLNSKLEQRALSADKVKRAFEKWWPELEAILNDALSEAEVVDISPKANKKTPEFIRHYPNKWAMPESNRFWRNLSANATRRFGLVGRTNKSWISKDPAESLRFASCICDLIHGGGNVFIVSLDEESERHISFFRSVVIPQVNSLDTESRAFVKRRIATSLVYATYSDKYRITYRSVLSDSRLIIMPDMFSPEHRDGSLVLELNEGRDESFEYYFNDLSRLVSRHGYGNPFIAEIAADIHE